MEISNENELIEYIKNKDAKESLEIIDKYENLVVKKYYEITKIKIECLLNLNRFLDAKLLISNELSVPYIPRDFETFLIESNKICNQNITIKKDESTFDLDNIDTLNNEELKTIIPTLSKYNLNNYLDKISNVLLNKEIYGYLKTLIIASLSDNKINKVMSVYKNNKLISFNPVLTMDLRESTSYIFFKKELENMIDVEINYIDNIDQLVTLILLDYYPEIISIDEVSIIIAFAINYTNKINMASICIPKYEKILLQNSQKIDNYTKKINEILKTI